MATNKNAVIRYQALDKCFSNFQKKYFIEDLVEACNDALSEYDSQTSGVQRRQVMDDISFMRDSLGYAAPIESIREGRRVYYRYDDPDFSINKAPLNAGEAQQLIDSITMLNRFKNMPGFEWIEEVIKKLEVSFKLNSTTSEVIGFDRNIDLKGLREFFTPLFEAIVAKQALLIKYVPFKTPAFEKVVSPYYLKQYNNRWYLMCRSEGKIWTFALDRIESVKISIEPYIPNRDIDFNEFFEDIVGVTHPEGVVETKVVLQVADDYVGYFTTKPIHGTMHTRPNNVFEFSLIPNYELETFIVSHSDKIKVLEPESLKLSVKKRLKAGLKYQDGK